MSYPLAFSCQEKKGQHIIQIFNPYGAEYVCVNYGDQRFFYFEIIINVLLSWLFSLHLNTYVMGLRPLSMCNSFSAGIDLRRQNLTSVRQLMTSKVDPRAKKVNMFNEKTQYHTGADSGSEERLWWYIEANFRIRACVPN